MRKKANNEQLNMNFKIKKKFVSVPCHSNEGWCRRRRPPFFPIEDL